MMKTTAALVPGYRGRTCWRLYELEQQYWEIPPPAGSIQALASYLAGSVKPRGT